jgi:hypothetical protein
VDDKLKEQCAERKATRRPRGRPKKAEVATKKKGNRGQVGRPKGDAAIINEYKARMLASPKSELVLQTIFDAATNDDHKNQAAAWKLIMDRILPVGAFEKDVIKDGGRSAIQINITGVGSTEVSGGSVIDSSYATVDGDSGEILPD